MKSEYAPPATILIIDDDAASLHFLSDYFSRFGFHVLIKRDGKSGLDLARQKCPDLILLDVLMPGMDGYEICRALKADQITQDIPILFMSALTETFDKLKGFEAGGVDYITKPFQVEELRVRINTHLSLRALQKTLERQNTELQQQISERQATEQMLQQRNRELLLLNRGTRLLSSSLELDQILDTLLQEVQYLLDVVSLSFWLIVPENEVLLCLQAKGAGKEELINWRLPLSQGITGWVARHGESVVVPDTWKDSRYFQAVDHQTGVSVRSMISIPLRSKGNVIGVLNLADSRVDHFGHDELVFVESLAAAASSAVENARLYEKSQQEIAERKHAEELLRKLAKAVETTEVGITITDNDGRIVYVNPADAEMHGYRVEELIGQRSNIFAANHSPAPRIPCLPSNQAGAFWKRERMNRRKDGSVFPVRLISNLIKDRYDHPIGRVIVCEDITERKRVEDLLFKQTTLLHSVAKAMTCLLVTTDFDEAISQVLSLLGFATEADRVYIVKNISGHENGELLMRRQFEWVKNNTECSQEKCREFRTVPYSPDFLRWYDLLHAGQPLYGLVRNFPRNEQSWLTAQRVLSIIIVPIMIQDQFWGCIGFDACETEREWGEEEQSILLAMAGSIGGAIARQKAEERLLSANSELKNTLEHLQRTQAQLIVSEKMAALGQLVAGIAHELNTPIGAIRSSIHDIASLLDQTLKQLPTFVQHLPPSRQEDFWALLKTALQKDMSVSLKDERQLKRTLLKKLEQYDVASPHKIADMLVNIGVYEQIEPYLDLLKSPEHPQILDMMYRLFGLHESTNTIITAVERVTKVIFALKTYSHYDHSEAKVQANIIEGLETILTLYQSQIKNGVEIRRQYQQLAPILCYPDELNQVWTNLIHNALQAMKNKGVLTIETTQEDAQVVVSITDSGCGIPQEIRERIFEPFFTTKPAGEGSGLGLDIVKKIIDKHQGMITVNSRPGKTTFRVTLPKHAGG